MEHLISLYAKSPSSSNMTLANIPEIMESLPVETRFTEFPLRQYGGFWLLEVMLNGVAAAETSFQPRPSDILLSSFPKCGTTWLKALAFATLNRSTYPPSDEHHPLLEHNPHDLVGFLEIYPKLELYESLPSPRLLSTHLPYSMLPHRIREQETGCRLVYIYRDPKDAMVSMWHQNKKEKKNRLTFEEMFDMFCEGRCVVGPQWCHAGEYWDESQARPEKVLFLMYEDLLQDTVGNLRTLAEFMGCGLSRQEEDDGIVQQIVELCSLNNLKNLNVNKSGTTLLGISKDGFFRKGGTGDWSNHMSPEMAARLDKIVKERLEGSGHLIISRINAKATTSIGSSNHGASEAKYIKE